MWVKYSVMHTFVAMSYKQVHYAAINTLRPREDGRRLPDDTFERIFLNENVQFD